MRLGKTFGVAGLKLNVFAECFNCSNGANRGLGSVFSTWAPTNTNTPSATFGKYNSYGDPRTFQLAARIDF